MPTDNTRDYDKKIAALKNKISALEKELVGRKKQNAALKTELAELKKTKRETKINMETLADKKPEYSEVKFSFQLELCRLFFVILCFLVCLYVLSAIYCGSVDFSWGQCFDGGVRGRYYL
jgi:regulator of replication initiation timing